MDKEGGEGLRVVLMGGGNGENVVDQLTLDLKEVEESLERTEH